ncbi:MAG: hypothetical protein ABI835_15955 [Chloroflexota bacterium]
MRILTLQVDDELAGRIEKLGRERNISSEDLIHEGVELYVRNEDLTPEGFVRVGTLLYVTQPDDSVAFDSLVDELIEEQTWLLDELAKR